MGPDANLKAKRQNWADAFIDGTVPGDIAQDRQAELAGQLSHVEQARMSIGVTTATHELAIENIAAVLANCGGAYETAKLEQRRMFNQAWFDRLLFRTDDDQHVVLGRIARTEVGEAMHTAEMQPVDAPVAGRKQRPGSVRYRVMSTVRGSNLSALVGDTGIEPVTPAV